VNLKERLRRLKKEKESRARGASFRKWKKERAEFTQKCREGYSPEAGELANMIDGLTPDGYNKNGKKVSFVERGWSGSGPAEKVTRLS